MYTGVLLGRSGNEGGRMVARRWENAVALACPADDPLPTLRSGAPLREPPALELVDPFPLADAPLRGCAVPPLERGCWPMDDGARRGAGASALPPPELLSPPDELDEPAEELDDPPDPDESPPRLRATA